MIKDYKPSNIVVGFPPPLDKPLEALPTDSSILQHMRLVIEKINELVERQNAIIELLQKLAMK